MVILSILKNRWFQTGSIVLFVMVINAAVLCAATATLSWNPPAENSDGTPLTDLDGYVVYVGTSPDDYTQTIDVGNATSHIINTLVEDLPYYFAVTAYDTSGNESDYSNQESIMISSPPPPEPEPPVSSGAPDISVTDSVTPPKDLQLPFGDVTELNSRDHTLTVKNRGDADLEIDDILQVDSLTSPFSIYNDNCSWQSLAPLQSCSLTVRFSPLTVGSFLDSIRIPSNDSNESVVTVAVTGTGLSSVSNNSPSTVALVSPKNNGKGSGKFKWKKSSDPDGDVVTYDLVICESPDMTTGCVTETVVASVTHREIYYAGIGSFSTVLMVTGIFFLLPFSRKKTLWVRQIIILTILAGMLLLTACGGGGSGGGSASGSSESAKSVAAPDESIPLDEIVKEVPNLNNGTTYYWQVVAKDVNGGETNSQVWSFEQSREN